MDARTFRLALVLLGAVAVLCTSSIVWLEAIGRPSPTALTSLGSTALGAIAGLLSQRPPDTTVKQPRS